MDKIGISGISLGVWVMELKYDELKGVPKDMAFTNSVFFRILLLGI